MKITSIVAVAAAALWIASEVIEAAGGGIGPWSLALTTLAFAALVPGTWSLRGALPVRRSWRVALSVLSASFGLMALVAGRMWLAGQTEHAEDALFISAVTTLAIGIVAVGVLSLRRAYHPRPLSAGFLVAGMASLGANAANLGVAANLANVLLAVALSAMALHALRPAAAELAWSD